MLANDVAVAQEKKAVMRCGSMMRGNEMKNAESVS